MMNRARRHATIFGAVLASLAVQVQTAFADDRVSIRLRVENPAAVPGGILGGAQSDATRIFRQAGIDIVWLKPGDPECSNGGRVIRVVLPSLKNVDQYLQWERVNKNALGDANATASLIHIFWERLAVSAARHGRDEAGLLGVVLAHEIGHVLLPGAGHSATGIMQASVEIRMLAPLRFTVQQSEEMRRHLRQEPDITVSVTQAISVR